jgi:hypothetical protein
MAGCRHPDIQRFDDIRCCLSCGEAIFETAPRLPATARYQYQPLEYRLGQEIRLVELYPGESSDDLKIDLIHVNLADKPVYEAVSYTWVTVSGDKTFSQDIHCHDGLIAIMKSCEAVLRRLRLPIRRRRLWIDAISINQSDTTEKNHQVRLMSTIYTTASQVIAYLGVDSSEMNTGLERVLRWLQNESLTPVDMPWEGSVANFISLPYFDRVWVLQEVGLARLVTAIIGSHSIHWTGTTISKILALCSTMSLKPPSVLRWTPASRPEEENDLLAVLSKGRNCSATDPKDKVYALLGLTHLRFSNDLPIDYSLSHIEVFTRIAIYLIERGQLDVLKHTTAQSQSLEQALAPSWVPLWHVKDVREVLPSQFSEDDMNTFSSSWYMASDISTQHTSHSTTTEYLDKMAKEVDHEGSRGFHHAICQRFLLPHELKLGLPSYTTHLPYLKIRAHVLNKIFKKLPPTSKHMQTILPRGQLSAFKGTNFCSSCSESNVAALGLKHEESQVDRNARAAFRKAVSHCGVGKTVFTTEHSIGFTRAAFKVGDTICVLDGVDVPIILRQAQNHFILVGECYLHRAGLPFPCAQCGADTTPWPMETRVIDIW